LNYLNTVIRAYTGAWHRKRIFLAVHLSLRLLALALVVPFIGGLVNLGVSLSDQSALTDQDIAVFLISPVGFVVALGVLSLVLVAEIAGFAIMAAVLRFEQPSRWQTARVAILSVLRQIRPLTIFTAMFVVRVLAIALPFALVGLLVAMWHLSDFDINYYLSFRPPEFKLAAVLIGIVVLVLALALLLKLSSWAIAPHLLLFEEQTPHKAFAESAERMHGHRRRLQIELAIWFAFRVALAGVMAVVVGWLMANVPVSDPDNLKFALLISLIVLTLWIVGGAVLSSIALGALALILDGHFDGPKTAPPFATARSGLRRTVTMAGLGFLALSGLALWAGGQMIEAVKAEDDVDIIAHRGAAGSRPENTLASVEEALKQDTDWVEIDVQETLDGRVVVIHDSDYMKIAQVNLKVWDATYADLDAIDIGGWFDPAYGDQRTPLLSEVLEMAKGKAKVIIELKYYGHDEDLENRVIREVEAAGMADQVAIMSLSYPAIQKFQKLRPHWRTGVLAATSVGNIAGLQGDFLAVRSAIASPGLVNSVGSAGKDLYVWTVNDPLEISKMASKGVDGIITDEPGLARKVLEFRAGLNTAERLILWFASELGLSLNSKGYRDDSP
jgi:glycerophosphoryl diester phosphodiesterase